MEQKFVKFIKFHGYLLFAAFLLYTVREVCYLSSWDYTTLSYDWTMDPDAFVRNHPVVRWVMVATWLLALALLYCGLQWEDKGFVLPAVVLFTFELLNVLLEDLLVTINDHPYSRLFSTMDGFLISTAFIIYVLYCFYILRALFSAKERRKTGPHSVVC